MWDRKTEIGQILVFNSIGEWLPSSNQFHVLHRPRRKKLKAESMNDKVKKNDLYPDDTYVLHMCKFTPNPTAVYNEYTLTK